MARKFMKEVWKDILGYEGLYQVSDLGRVKSFKGANERILKQVKDKNGRCSVYLCEKGKAKTCRISVLIAIAFLNHTPCGYKIVVDHKNNITTDNRLENLQLITHRENLSKDRKNGTSKYIGVTWKKARNKWYSQIRIDGKLKHLGVFTDEKEASQAYQKQLELINI